MYQNYIFDLYGTLIDIRTDEESKQLWESLAKWMQRYKIQYTGSELKEKYQEQVRKLLEKPTKYKYVEIDILQVFEKICKDKNTDILPKEIWSVGEQFRMFSTTYLGLYENTINVLDALKKAGKKIYLLSNAQKVFTWRELECTGILPYFDDVFISSDIGCKKPDPCFFGQLIDKHQLKIGESIMIGNDESSDIIGANKMGMDAMYIHTEISPKDGKKPQCKYVFEDGDIGHVLELIKNKERSKNV